MLTSTLEQLLQTNPLAAMTGLIFVFIAYIVLGLLPMAGLLYGIYYLLTLPLRRCERARFFLDLLELGLKEGRSPEAAVMEAAGSHDDALGVRFNLLAAQIQQGLRLGEALARVPRLVPPSVAAMLQTGERIGDVSRVLAACRLRLGDGVSQVRGALNYLLVLLLVTTPLTVVVPIFLRSRVLPRFHELFREMAGGMPLPPFARFLFMDDWLLVLVPASLLLAVWILVLAYLAGPRLQQWVQRRIPVLSDWFLTRFPWRRKRLQRDFSSMLAVLLDAEVPEPEAVRLAGEATANAIMRRRASAVCERLAAGASLPEAIQLVDDSGELHWRLTVALRHASGFVRALSGWNQALDAKAFQLEQAAAQIATTLVVILNGLIVGCVVAGMFLLLIELINQVSLW